MDRNNLVTAGQTWTYLRGLIGVPIGAVFLLAGFTDREWGPFGSPWLLWGGVLVCLAAGFLVDRWYRQNYGRVTPPAGTRVRDVAWTVFGVIAVIGFAVVDSLYDLPVNGYVTAYGLMMLGYIASSIGLKLRHAVVGGSLILVGLLPVWGGVDDVGLGLFPMGIATMVSGAIDHRVFVANLGPSRPKVDGHAGA